MACNCTIKSLQTILCSIKQSNMSGDGYSVDKKAIRRVFDLTDGSRTEDVMARLALIDGMYSTQMNRRYYPLEDLAGILVALEKKAPLKDAFIGFTKDLDTSRFDVGKENLWSKGYGIGKDGKSKGAAVSLISKYAYFETGYKFPIYDSIACEVLPLLWPIVMGNDDVPELTIKNSKQQMMGNETIVSFITAINMLKEKLGADADYDTLDRLMWYTGKMLRGNFSLVFSKEEYIEWTNVAKKVGITFNNEGLATAVKRIDAGQLPFLDKDENTFVKMVYELAQKLIPS